jgi:hypothetical protein
LVATSCIQDYIVRNKYGIAAPERV